MPKVFIVNEPDVRRLPKDENGQPRGELWDTSTASFFGDIEYVFLAGSRPPVRNREKAIARAHEVLNDAEPGDFLLWAGGDPFGMVLAASILADYTDGQFTYLMWDRAAETYAPIPVKLFTGEDE